MLTWQLYDPEEESALQFKESSVFFNVKMPWQCQWYIMPWTVELSISLATSNTALWLQISAACKITFQDSKDSGDTNLLVLSEQWMIQSQYIFRWDTHLYMSLFLSVCLSVCCAPYLRNHTWSGHKMMISPGVFFNFLKFWFFGLLGG